MGRLDRRVGGRRVGGGHLVDLRVLRAGVRQGQSHGIGADAGSHDGRVVEAARGKGACIHRRARRQRGHRQRTCAQAADIHRTHGDCVGPCERAACSTRQYVVLRDRNEETHDDTIT